MFAGDAPVSMHREITGKLSGNGQVALELYEENSDGGEEEETTESKNEHYKFEIFEGKIKIISEKKDKSKIVIKKIDA